MRYHLLESGSKGNCLTVGSGPTTIIIDCGGPKKYLADCFESLHIDYQQAAGLLLTHQHTDHIKQLAMFDRLTVYAPFEVRSVSDEHLVIPYQPFGIANLTITPLALSHDADITVGYIIDDGNEKLVEITDTGYVSQANEELIRNADYYIFESNYDTEMLMHSERPAYLKARIRSDIGHMCNQDAAVCLCRVIGSKTKEITLAHISQQTNTVETALYSLKNEMLARKIGQRGLLVRAAEQFKIYSGGTD